MLLLLILSLPGFWILLCHLLGFMSFDSSMFVSAAAPPECTTSNLIQDPGFDQPLETIWNTFGYPEPGAITIVSGELRIENTVSGDIGVDQTLNLNEFGGTLQGGDYEVFVWNRLKVDSATSGALVSADLHFRYADDSTDVLISTLDYEEGSDPLGVWMEKTASLLLPRGKILDRINFYLLIFYENGLAWYDDVCLFVREVQTWEWELNDFTVRLLESSSEVEEVEKVYFSASFVELILDTSERCESVAVSLYGGTDDVFEFSFEAGGPCEPSLVRVKITSGLTKDYLVTELSGGDNLGSVERILFGRFDLDDWKEDTEWATSADADGKMFGSAVALDENVVCKSWNWLYCYVERGVSLDGMENGRSAFVFARKESFDEAVDRMIQAEGMPRLLHGPAQIPLRNGPIREDYLFAYPTHDNYRQLLSYAQKGNFPVFLMIQPLHPGADNRPGDFADLEEFMNDMKTFTDAGIGLGLHHFSCRVDSQDSLFSVSNLAKYPVGTLAAPLGIGSTIATSSINVETDPDFVYLQQYVSEATPNPVFAVGDELLECSSVSGSSLSGCFRGAEGTTDAFHAMATQLHFVPRVSGGGLLLDPWNGAAIASSVSAFAEVANDPRLRIKYVFADGVTHIPPRDSTRDGGLMYTHRLCMTPYYEAMTALEYGEYAEGEASFDFFYANRYTTWDGVVFKSKLFSRNFKVPHVLARSPYSIVTQYFGWWKIHGSLLETGIKDYDSTTLDDVHYVMSKVFVTDTSIGVELMSHWEKHSRMDDVLDVFSRYHKLIAEDIIEPVVSIEFKETFKDPEKELELLPDLNFIEKKTVWEYVSWDGSFGSSNTFSLNNPFESQPIVLEIRPRPSYVGFDSLDNELITDFTTAGSWPTSVSDGDVSCSIGNGGDLTFQNDVSSDVVGGCRIDIPMSPVDLTFKRGFGLDLMGDSSGVMIVVHAHYPTVHGMRDFRVDVDFTGQQQLLLGDPATDIDYLIGETLETDWDYHHNRLSWEFDWDEVIVSLYVFGVPGTSSTGITLHSLKGLAETQGYLFDPTINLGPATGGADFQFFTLLQFNDSVPYLYDYNGRVGKIYHRDSNQKVLSSTSISAPLTIDSGDVTVVLGSASAASTYNRADVRITLYGDVHRTRIGGGFWTWENILWVVMVSTVVPCVIVCFIAALVVCIVCRCRRKEESVITLGDVPLREKDRDKR